MMGTIVRFSRDLKTAARSLAHAKALSVTVILTLALGIGANAAMFTLLRGVLLRLAEFGDGLGQGGETDDQRGLRDGSVMADECGCR